MLDVATSEDGVRVDHELLETDESGYSPEHVNFTPPSCYDVISERTLMVRCISVVVHQPRSQTCPVFLFFGSNAEERHDEKWERPSIIIDVWYMRGGHGGGGGGGATANKFKNWLAKLCRSSESLD